MAAKLRLISKTIPWSLLGKSLVAAAVWLVLPYWLFLIPAVGFYFIPFFEPRRLLLPFLLFLVFAALLPRGFSSALLLALVFFLIIGTKNLVLVDRAAAYETLFFVLFFLAAAAFFGDFQSPSGRIFAASAGAALVFALLLKNFLGYSPKFAALAGREKLLITGLAGIIVWQWLLAILFLPMNRFYQTALLFLGGAVLAELLFAYVSGSLEKKKLLAWFSVFFAAVAMILAANNWRI
jgi:hypothetical protein